MSTQQKRKRKLTRREFLKAAGATTAAVGGTMAFPGILKYALGETPIKIGVCVSLSGTASVMGQDFVDGTMLALDQVNAKGGVLGRKVEAIIRDDATTAGLASTRAKELIEKDNVDFLAGGVLGLTMHAQHAQTFPMKKLFMGNAMSEEVTAVPMFSRYTFHPDVTPHMISNAMGRFAAEKLGRRWYFLVCDYAWGWQNYYAFSKILQEYKGENLGVSPHPLGTKDYSAYIGKIMAANPEVLVSASPGFDQVNSWKQLREFGAFEKMKIVSPLFMPGTIWAVGIDVVMGGYGGATFYWEAPETVEVSNMFWKRFGKAPTDDALSQYECVLEICSAVERTRSLDVEKLIPALEGHRFKWAKGEEWWRPCDHQAIQDVYVLEPKKPTKKYDTFNIIDKKGGEMFAKTCEEQGHKMDKGVWKRYQ